MKRENQKGESFLEEADGTLHHAADGPEDCGAFSEYVPNENGKGGRCVAV